MNQNEVRELLAGFEITGCAIRNAEEMAFVAQDMTIDDPMEPHETRVFVYKRNSTPDEQWGSAGLGTCRAMHVCPSYAKGERWLFVSGTGDVFLVEDTDADFELPLEDGAGYIWGAKAIGKSSSYFVGPRRKVIQRTQKNVTSRLHSGALEAKNLVKESGFRDVDGFGSNDLYACGGLGDLWHYNGTEWHFIDLATNVPLQLISCGSNGKVHILAGGRFLFIGREDEWTEVAFENFENLVGDIEWYRDRLILVTETSGYELVNNQIALSPIIASSPLNFYSYLACYDTNILLVNGSQAAFFDGKNWSRLF